MGKDYVQRRSAVSRNQARSRGGRSGGVPGWVWAFAGLSIGLTIAAFTYISRPAPSPMPEATPAAAVTPKETKKSITVPPKEPSRFSFYEMLPSYEVVIPGEPKPAKGKTPAIGEPGEYLIQVGSFRSRGEADGQKAKLALIGIESRVESVTIDDKDTWFRVRIGPEKDPARVQSLMARLQENSVQSYLIRLKPEGKPAKP